MAAEYMADDGELGKSMQGGHIRGRKGESIKYVAGKTVKASRGEEKGVGSGYLGVPI